MHPKLKNYNDYIALQSQVSKQVNMFIFKSMPYIKHVLEANMS